MHSVLILFLLPWGGGIPAGVLRAQALGLRWPVTAGLYLVSDMILAAAFEPLLQALVRKVRGTPRLAPLRTALKTSLQRSTAPFLSHRLGPLAFILVAFGLDPMSGRASTLLAGHGPVAGWSLAISGDLLYYAVVAGATLGLNAWLKRPELTVGLVMAGMLLLPSLVQRLRARFGPRSSRDA